MARNYAALPHEYLREMKVLSDAEFGRLCRALIQYSADGTVVALSGNERFFSDRVMMQEDRFRDNYEESSNKRRASGQRGASARWQGMANDGNAWQTMANDSKVCDAMPSDGKNGNTETKTKTKQISEKENTKEKAPSLADIEAYCSSRENDVDPKKFFDYYTAAGWKDKDGKPVRSWKQKVISWEGGRGRSKQTAEPAAQQVQNSAPTRADIERMKKIMEELG